MSTTAPYTIPASWTAPTSCFATTNYYYVLLGSGYFSNMYGTPTPVLTGNTPSGPCIPPSFTIDQPYSTTGGCPEGFTLACASATTASDGQAASQVTCCPSVTSDVFSFMCKDDQYGCHATATAGVVWTGVETNIGIATPTEEPITRTPSTAEGIEAWGIKLISFFPSTASSTSPPSTQATGAIVSSSGTGTTTSLPLSTVSTASLSTETGNSSSGTGSTSHGNGSLQTGSIVGIAIGSAAAAIFAAIGAFLLYRRKKRRNAALVTRLPVPPVEAPTATDDYKPDPRAMPYQLSGEAVLPPNKRVWELQG